MKKIKTQICRKCKKEKPLSTGFYYHRQRKRYMSSCKTCNSKACVNYQRNSDYRKTLKYVFYQRAYGITRIAKSKKIRRENRKTLEKHLHELWLNQKGLCYYTGEKMSLIGYHTNPKAMTVDRINPKKGYVKKKFGVVLFYYKSHKTKYFDKRINSVV